MAFGGLNYLREPQLGSETAIGAVSQPTQVLGYTTLTIYFIGEGTISAGAVTIEEATLNPATEGDYDGTWSEIAIVDVTAVSGGKQYAYHVGGPGGQFAYSNVRTRISTGITGSGGKISTVLVAC